MDVMPQLATYNYDTHFEEQGYARLGKLISVTECSALKQRLDDLMLGRIKIEGITFQLDGETGEYANLVQRTVGPSQKTLAYRRIDELHLDPLFLTYMQHPVFRQITRRYIGEEVSVFRSMLMNKPANKGTVLPWHQDIGAGWGINTNPVITIWTALDDAKVATGCMQIIPGSQKLGILNDKHYTSEEDQKAYCTADKIIDLEVEAGEAILLHNYLLHRSGVNKTSRARRAFSVTYMEASTKHVQTGAHFPLIFGEGALCPRLAQ